MIIENRGIPDDFGIKKREFTVVQLPSILFLFLFLSFSCDSEISFRKNSYPEDFDKIQDFS